MGEPGPGPGPVPGPYGAARSERALCGMGSIEPAVRDIPARPRNILGPPPAAAAAAMGGAAAAAEAAFGLTESDIENNERMDAPCSMHSATRAQHPHATQAMHVVQHTWTDPPPLCAKLLRDVWACMECQGRKEGEGPQAVHPCMGRHALRHALPPCMEGSMRALGRHASMHARHASMQRGPTSMPEPDTASLAVGVVGSAAVGGMAGSLKPEADEWPGSGRDMPSVLIGCGYASGGMSFGLRCSARYKHSTTQPARWQAC